jgi:hypothetical protein
MKIIPAFETPDKSRFFREEEARMHERRCDFNNLVETAVRSHPSFARLDHELLVDFLMKHGSTAGKLADSPILPQRSFGVSGPAEEAERQVPRAVSSAFEAAPRFGHTGGIVGEKRPTASIMTPPGDPMDVMVAELDRELAKG